MMDLHEFITDDMCPVCGNTLTLYAQAIGDACFKASYRNGSKVEFVQHIPEASGEPDKFILKAEDGDGLIYMVERLRSKYEQFPFYFFQLCNTDSLTVKKSTLSIDKYEINASKACCRRSTKRMPITVHNKYSCLFKLELPFPENSVLRSERFGFNRWVRNQQKVYVLSLDHDTKSSRLWYYSCTEEDLCNKDFEPKVFFKDIGALSKKMDFRNTDALMDRFDSWVLMS